MSMPRYDYDGLTGEGNTERTAGEWAEMYENIYRRSALELANAISDAIRTVISRNGADSSITFEGPASTIETISIRAQVAAADAEDLARWRRIARSDAAY